MYTYMCKYVCAWREIFVEMRYMKLKSALNPLQPYPAIPACPLPVSLFQPPSPSLLKCSLIYGSFSLISSVEPFPSTNLGNRLSCTSHYLHFYLASDYQCVLSPQLK